MPHLQVQGKGGKLRFLPAHPHSLRLVAEYLAAAGQDLDGPLFRRVRAEGGNGGQRSDAGICLCRGGVVHYMNQLGIAGENMGPHALRATEAAASALKHQADIAKVQEWLGHASITRVYDRRGFRPEDLPTFKVAFIKFF